MAQDLFKENPQCLELNDLLIEAERLMYAGDVDTSREITQEAIYRCKGLVTSEEFPLNFYSLSRGLHTLQSLCFAEPSCRRLIRLRTGNPRVRN